MTAKNPTDVLKGMTPRLYVEVHDPATDELVDPDTLSVRIGSPVGRTFKRPASRDFFGPYVFGTDLELVQEATGLFYVVRLVDAVGDWTWEATATMGAETIIIERSINVKLKKLDGGA